MQCKSVNEAGLRSLLIAATEITELVVKSDCVGWGERNPRTF